MSEHSPKSNPFINAAAIAVIIFSAVGVAALMGVLPGRGAKTETPPAAAAQAESGKATGDAATPTQPAMTSQTGVAAEKAGKSAAEEKPAAKPVQRAAAERPTARMAAAEEGTKQAQAPVCANCGTITAIRTVEQAGEGTGLGAIAGGVAGALLGSQVGAGRGKDVATIAGAVGGGYAGHQIEKKVKTTKHYEIGVRMDDGSHRTMTQETEPAFAIGDKVKIVDGALVRN